MVYFSKAKMIAVLLVCLLGIAFSAPNFFKEETLNSLPDWLPHKHVNLGLDLQGGSHLLVEVEFNVVINEQLETVVDDVRTALRKARIKYTGLGVDGKTGVKVTIRNADKTEEARSLLRALGTLMDISESNNTIRLVLTEKAITEKRSSAIAQSISIIGRRIDPTGTRELSIQRQGDERILIQLPGVKNPERIKRLLGKTAKMSFHSSPDQ